MNSGADPLSLVPPPLRHLVSGFLKGREEDIVVLRNFYRQKDFDGVKMMGHRLKGTGTGYGFSIISTIGEGLEHAAQKKDLVGIEDLVTKLHSFVNNLVVLFTGKHRH